MLLPILAPGTAQAAIVGALLPAGVSAIALAGGESCRAGLQPAVGIVPPSLSAEGSKSTAILGGQVSRLEQIALQQGGITAGMPRPSTMRTSEIPALSPQAAFADCSGLVRPAINQRNLAPGIGAHVLGSDDFLASRRVAITRSPFDKEWSRVGRDRLNLRQAVGLVARMRGAPDLAMLTAVNAWTNARIRYVEDETLYGRADYWAGARTTLRKRAGDCEDIAVVKLQLLAALGVKRSDMYLTVARDLARNADHAMLIVRLDGRNWLLDNSTSEVLDAAESHDYRPIVSYSENRKWLHGY